MEPTPILISLDIGLVLALVIVLDRNILTYAELLLQNIPTQLSLQFNKRVLGIRLWLDRQAMVHRGPLGRLWNEYCIWRIRTNPAYKEFFTKQDDQV